ncbi:MAG: hypothetical protein ACLR02_05465 [Clostridium sp.]|jgi:hypothetical protein|nr:hypothetical protein [Clostridium sp.]
MGIIAFIIGLGIYFSLFIIGVLAILFIGILEVAKILLPMISILIIIAVIYSILKWKKMRNKEKSILERVYTIGFNLLTALSIICFIGIIICFIIKNIIDFSSILIGIMAIGLVYSLMGLAILVLLNKLLLKIKNKELRNVKWW